MTEPDIAISIAPAGDIVVLDMWGAGEPELAGVRAMQVEARRWWLIEPGETLNVIRTALGDNGALTSIGGGLMRATLAGPSWRSQLMISGAFDAENAGFKPGNCAATIIGHASVWIDVVSDSEAHVYFAASLRNDMEHLWRLREMRSH